MDNSVKVGVISDIGSVADAAKSVSELVNGILTRSDRDKPDKEKNENVINIQNAFAKPDDEGGLDDQYRLAYLLFLRAGRPLTASRNVGDAERDFRHSSLLLAADLIHERELASRAFASLVNGK